MPMTSSIYDIRCACDGDIPALSGLFARSYGASLRGDYAADVLERALPLITRVQPDLIRSDRYFVAIVAGQIAGAGGWSIEAPGSGLVTSELAHIRHVVVDRNRQGQGVGRSLIRHIIQTARDAGIRRFHCVSTLTAVPFYRACGFAQIDRDEINLPNGVAFPVVQMSL